MNKIKNKTILICSQCNQQRFVDLSKSNVEKYKAQHPICQKCRNLNDRDVISKTWFKKGQSSWNDGLRSEFNGKSYDGLHDWVERNLGKLKYCEICKTSDVTKVYQWSNKSGLYKSVLEDWQRLCVKCHQRYDYEKFGARKAFYT